MGRTVSVLAQSSKQLRQVGEVGKAGHQREVTPAGQWSTSHIAESDSLSSWFAQTSGSVCSVNDTSRN